jgi:hypothetical protein
MTKKKTNKTETEAEETKAPETKSVTWRMPTWVADAHKGDWSEFRAAIEEWAEEAEELDIELPEETTSVCLRMPIPVLDKLEKEAKRLSKRSKRKITAGKVARMIYEERFEKAG